MVERKRELWFMWAGFFGNCRGLRVFLIMMFEWCIKIGVKAEVFQYRLMASGVSRTVIILLKTQLSVSQPVFELFVQPW